jgi:hypothetical protein
MASELLIVPLEPEGVRGGLREDGEEGGFLGVVDGAMVSCSERKVLPSIVAAELRSSRSPHDEQNFPAGETSEPQVEQYMGGRILPPRETMS